MRTLFTFLFFSLCAQVFAASDSEIDRAIESKIILCTGPSLGRKHTLKENTEKDMEYIPFKKIFLSTNDPENLDVLFNGKPPTFHILPKQGKQLDCLNCIISSVNMVANDLECDDDDIIIFKHESVYISDMNLVRKAIGKILDGHDMVVKYWIGLEETKGGVCLNDVYHTDSFYLKVGSARQYLKNHPLIREFNDDYHFCEEYFTKHWVSQLPNIFQIDFQHSFWYDNELGFHHTPRWNEALDWLWDKKNYNDIYK